MAGQNKLPPWTLSILTLGFLFFLPGGFALVCTDAAGPRALFKTTCEHDLACRFEVVDNARVGGGSDWTLPLQARIDDILFGLASRAYFEDPVWHNASGALVVVNATAPGAVDCGALPDPPPLEVRLAVAVLVQYQSYVAEDGRCSDLNTIAVVAANGSLTCQCLPDKVCQPSGQQRVDLMLTTTIVLTLIVILGQFIAVIVAAVPRFRQFSTPVF